MAVSSSSGIGSTVIPTLENNFDLRIEAQRDSRSQVLWKNPHMNSVITPYIPSDGDQALLESCKAAFEKVNPLAALTPEAVFMTNDVSVIIFSLVDPQTLSRCTKVSKSFHWVTKNQTIWRNQLASLVPNAKPLGAEVCIFSTQQQFQIIYKKINDLRKPYYAIMDYLKERIPTIIAELKLLGAEVEALGGNEAVETAEERLQEIVDKKQLQNDWGAQDKLKQELMKTDEFRILFLNGRRKMGDLRLQLIKFDRQNITAPVESIQINHYLDRLTNAIEGLIPASIIQDKFEDAIRQAEALKKHEHLPMMDLVIEDAGRMPPTQRVA